MLANFFGKSKPINFIVITILFFCFFLLAISATFFMDEFSVNGILKSAGFLLLFLLVFFLYNFIISKNRLTFDNTYAFFLFVVFSSFTLSSFTEYNQLIIFLLHLFFLRKIYSLKSKNEVLIKVFDAGFWLGISFILEPITFVFFTLIYAAIIFHKKVTIHTLITPIIGFITPLILFFTYCFWVEKTNVFLSIFKINTDSNITFYLKNSSIWLICLLLLLIMVSLFLKSPKALSVNNSFKRNWILLFVNALIGLSFLFLIEVKKGSEFLFFLFPASIIIANGLEVIEKKVVKNAIIITVLIVAFSSPFLL